MTVEDTFKYMQSHFNAAAAAGFNKTYQVHVTGEQGGTYALKIENQTCQLIKGGVEKPDVTFTISSDDWLAIAQGKLNPMQAFMSGKVKVAGDMMLAMRLQNLFNIG
ncbi:putative sterol carrier protein [Thermosporothrix hazakensis]|jgi:putative sterol carrier protein|uniref:SCP2 domain-containing protein n=2 Tax=Thermosporothrix TaxID=768650 RepID=A0A455SVH9_9CHLR|nr:SCP2 sterol-binding domain-containing protein [Thermosporothrix hazakensis]PZW18288.1 putative sterol carrier protein [Thermosporothrix hazakensis]BBH91129.1 hypothetical protein KTC_58800 [Thermosporothrix sp. COM3]GCE49246.1 hypothetical protein KTH_41150 [Thermosporothrix hazakensis]